MRKSVLLVLVAGLLVAADNDKKDDKDRIQGTWTVVSGERGGEPAPADVVESLKVTFNADKIKFEMKDRTRTGTFKLDADKKPRQITLTADDGRDKPLEGIYELDGDSLKLCFNEGGNGGRPEKFDSKATKTTMVMTFKRAKKVD